MHFPFARRDKLTRAQNEALGLRHSLNQNATEARRRERIAAEKVETERADLIASIVEDYYRAAAAIDQRPHRRGKDDPFIGRQFGIMDHATVLLARLTGRDTINLSYLLDHGLPVAGEAQHPGGPEERRAALMAPFREDVAGAYAHQPAEHGGPLTPRQRSKAGAR